MKYAWPHPIQSQGDDRPDILRDAAACVGVLRNEQQDHPTHRESLRHQQPPQGGERFQSPRGGSPRGSGGGRLGRDTQHQGSAELEEDA